MNKRELDLLERAYAAEVNAAINKSELFFIQTTSKLAGKLVDDGYLRRISVRLNTPWPVTCEGYALTDFGRLSYCMTCKDES